jgi:hypothetical protein
VQPVEIWDLRPNFRDVPAVKEPTTAIKPVKCRIGPNINECKKETGDRGADANQSLSSPKLVSDPSMNIPDCLIPRGLRDWADLREDSGHGKGRGVFATRRIPAGTVVFSETPFVSATDSFIHQVSCAL